MEKLDKLLIEIEDAQTTVDSALEKYEEGLKLYKEIRKSLESAREKIRSLDMDNENL